MLIELLYDGAQVAVTRDGAVLGCFRAVSETESMVWTHGREFGPCTACRVDGEEHDLKTDDDRVWLMKRAIYG